MEVILQGLILAAGMGKRLKHLTEDNTKCMVKVNGVSLIERMLRQLDKLNLSKIVIVVGYEGEKLIEYISTLNISTPVIFENNEIFYKTNNIYSLFIARHHMLEDDTLLLESDVILQDGILESLIADPRPSLALVDKYDSWMDGTCVKLNENDEMIEFVPGKRFSFKEIDEYYKTVNIYKFSKEFSTSHYVPFLEAYSKALGNNEYYEQVLKTIVMLDRPEIYAKRLNGELWYEIDDVQDLDIASSKFLMNTEEKLQAIQSRYGGYWRYSNILDFCYLVNPYFPPAKLVDELQASFKNLLTQYPSGMRVNSLIASKNFGILQEHIVVGNGAAELIKSLMEYFLDNNEWVGFIRPTFEEYPNRYDANKSVIFTPTSTDFSYTADDLINFFKDKNISVLVLINPDNPSGNYIPKADVLRLVKHFADRNVTVVLDESFVDFAEEENSTLIDEDIIQENKNLIIMKSISKSYGVPGLRLGVLVSENTELINTIRKDVGIWNINSFGEYFMQIFGKYQKDYNASLNKIKATRKVFYDNLSTIKEMKVISSQANYFMIEILDKITSHELTKVLLDKYDILIKDLSGKIKNGHQFIRIAVRDEVDNNKLFLALKEIFA